MPACVGVLNKRNCPDSVRRPDACSASRLRSCFAFDHELPDDMLLGYWFQMLQLRVN
jgi:hypothetical protein